MKITATRSGGFAGLTQTHEVDTSANPAAAALQADLAALLAAPPAAAPPVGADIPCWTITVDGDGARRSVSFAEDGNPANARLRALLDRILAT